MKKVEIVLKRGYVYEIMLRFESNIAEPQRKMGVCLQDQEICEEWDHCNFARSHSFKDNKRPLLHSWNVFVSPEESQSEFGIKIICNEIYSVEKNNILREAYKLPHEKIKEMDRKLLVALGL